MNVANLLKSLSFCAFIIESKEQEFNWIDFLESCIDGTSLCCLIEVEACWNVLFGSVAVTSAGL